MIGCSATTGRRPVDFGFAPAKCGQVVGVTSYVTTGGLRVGYCSRLGHEESVRRQFAEQDPAWPGDLPEEPAWDYPSNEFMDAMDAAKWEEDRKESWTAS